MYLTDNRYEEIKREVVDMYEECELNTYPINCFEIARRLSYKLVPYSTLSGYKLTTAMQISPDGFNMLVEQKSDGMLRWVIFYNDYNCRERQRWTIMHEIGHIRLDHSQASLLAETEANFFAKYSIAPPPLIHQAYCDNFMDIAYHFDLSLQAAYYAMEYYQKWLRSAKIYQPIEIRMLGLFGIAS